MDQRCETLAYLSKNKGPTILDSARCLTSHQKDAEVSTTTHFAHKGWQILGWEIRMAEGVASCAGARSSLPLAYLQIFWANLEPSHLHSGKNREGQKVVLHASLPLSDCWAPSFSRFSNFHWKSQQVEATVEPKQQTAEWADLVFLSLPRLWHWSWSCTQAGRDILPLPHFLTS